MLARPSGLPAACAGSRKNRGSTGARGDVSVGVCSACYIANLWQNPHNRTMKYILPIVLCAILLLGSSYWWTKSQHRLPLTLALPGQGGGDESNLVDARSSTGRGQELVAEAAKYLEQMPPFQAKIRHRIDLYRQQLSGSGSYAQLKIERKSTNETPIRNHTLTATQVPIKYRLELKLPVADQVGSLQHICDGEYLWV